nr:MAG TPA: hypothetical protein [Caudoviricetes sp.]
MISGSVLTRYELLHPDIAPIIPPNTAAPAKVIKSSFFFFMFSILTICKFRYLSLCS